METKPVGRAPGLSPARLVDREKASGGQDNALIAGSIVLTLDGALPVEFLTIGDRVITRDAGMAVLTGLRHARRSVRAVAVKSGSLGTMRPDRDVILAATQEILIRDWRATALFGASRVLVPAARLVDGRCVRDLGEVQVETVALVFDAPHILYADGLELASAAPKMADA